jgi:hypothetical protein
MAKSTLNARARVLLGAFTRLRIAVYILFMRNVVTKLTGNVNYSKTAPPLEEVTAKLDSLETKAQQALDGTKQNRVARDVEFASSLDQTRELADYVQLTAKGDLEILLSSGFTAAAGPGPKAPVNPPLNLRLSQGANTGEMDVRWVRNGRNSLVFDVQNATNPEGPYINHPSVTTSRTTLVGLKPGDNIWARVRANGAGGSSEWAGPISMMVI